MIKKKKKKKDSTIPTQFDFLRTGRGVDPAGCKSRTLTYCTVAEGRGQRLAIVSRPFLGTMQTMHFTFPFRMVHYTRGGSQPTSNVRRLQRTQTGSDEPEEQCMKDVAMRLISKLKNPVAPIAFQQAMDGLEEIKRLGLQALTSQEAVAKVQERLLKDFPNAELNGEFGRSPEMILALTIMLKHSLVGFGQK